MNVNVVHGTAHVLVDRSERHEQIASPDTGLLASVLRCIGKEIYETGKQIGFGQIEQSVQNVYARLVQLQEFIRIHFVHLRTAEEMSILIL